MITIRRGAQQGEPAPLVAILRLVIAAHVDSGPVLHCHPRRPHVPVAAAVSRQWEGCYRWGRLNR